VAESNDAATATEGAFANAFSGAEDSLVGFIATGKLEFQSLVDSVLADLARTTVRQTLTTPLAGALQSAFAGGGLFGLFHEGGIAGARPPAVRYADPGILEHAVRYHGGGFAGSGLLTDKVPIIARRGELVVPPERVVREEKTAREQRPITVVVNVTAADASSFRASQARSQPIWRARSTGRAATDERRSIPRRHRNGQGVAMGIAAAGAAKLPLEVEQLGVRRPAVLQQPGVDVGALSAGGTGRKDHVPAAQIVEPHGIARRNVLASTPAELNPSSPVGK
jgi:hypothetical protein